LIDDAMAIAQQLSRLSPVAFAQTKLQIRQLVIERLKKSGEATDKVVADIWAAPATLGHIRDYVVRTLTKS
jgi:enoyl-CoA hydratase/carnithine racemase